MAFPNTVDVFPVNVDHVDTVTAADVNNLQTAVAAVETYLAPGTHLPGEPATLTPTGIAAGKAWDWGGLGFHVKAGGVIGGAVGDQTAKFNAVIAAAVAVASLDATFGATVFMDADTFNVTALTYAGGKWTLRGVGQHSSTLRQTGGATFTIAATGAGYPYSDVHFEDFQIELWYNGASLGGIRLEGSQHSTCRRVFVNGCPAGGSGIQILGHGAAATGDAMYCTVQECEFNPQNAVSNCIRLSVAGGGGGSHPDACRILNNYVNGNANTTFLLIDVPSSGLGADNPIVAFNMIEGCGVPWDINTQGALVIGNRCEVTGGGATIIVYVRPGVSYPSLDNTFIANEYATGGNPLLFTFSDTGEPGTATWRICDGPPGDGTANSRNYTRLPANAIRVLAYSVAMTADAGIAEMNQIVATNGVAFTINAPGNPAKGRRVTYDLLNSSGGALGAITLNAIHLPAGAWVAPANGKRRLYSYYYDLTTAKWIELFRSAADI